MNVCGKYTDMNSMACRILFINPTK